MGCQMLLADAAHEGVSTRTRSEEEPDATPSAPLHHHQHDILAWRGQTGVAAECLTGFRQMRSTAVGGWVVVSARGALSVLGIAARYD